MQNYKVSTKIKTLSVEKVVPTHLLKQGFNWVVYEYSTKTGMLQNAYWLADYPDFKNVAPLLNHAKENCLLNTHVCVQGGNEKTAQTFATWQTEETAEVIATEQTQSQEQEEQKTEEEEKETVLTVRLNRELAKSFTESCKAEAKTKAEKTRELINDYLKTDSLIALNYSEIGCIGYLLKKEIDQCNIEIESRENIEELQKVDKNWLAMKGYYINRKIYLTKLAEKLNKYDLKDVPF